MPGIAGIVGGGPESREQLQRMAAQLQHEPTYASGHHSDPVLNCHFAWTRHAELGNTALPVWNTARDRCVVLCGELIGGAHAACATVDAAPGGPGEYTVKRLLDDYDRLGSDVLKTLNGWFSGVLIDHRTSTVLLFNDRFGVNRLYWRQTGRGFYFATEAKALLAVLPDSRTLDPDAVAETVSHGCVLGNRTLFRGLELLPPGSVWRLGPGREPVRQRYFDPAEWESQTSLDAPSFYEELKAVYAHTLPAYLTGPAPVGMSLTGGIDGRMIMAWARLAPGALPCYSFGSLYRDCHDVRLARRVARHCRQSHTTIETGAEFLESFPALAARCVRLSDGTMDVSGAVELHVNRKAREIAPIRLTGNYGSEIIRGNVAFQPRRLDPALFAPDFARRLDAARGRYDAERAVDDLSFIAFKQIPWHHHARLAVEQSQMTLRSPFLDNALVALMFRAPKSLRASKELSLRLIHDGDPALARLPTDRGLIYGKPSVAQRARSAVHEFSAKAEYAYDYGMPRWVTRVDSAVRPLGLERLFLGRHKFYHFRTWYRNQLAPYVKEVLLDRRALERSFFGPGVLQRLVGDHVAGRANHTLELHRALTLELTHRELLTD